MTESLRRITTWGGAPRPPGSQRRRCGPTAGEVAHPVSPASTPYAAGPRRRPRILRWVLLALLVVPVVEVAAIIGVGKVIGGWPTLPARRLVHRRCLAAPARRHTDLAGTQRGSADRPDAFARDRRRRPRARRRDAAVVARLPHRRRGIPPRPAGDAALFRGLLAAAVAKRPAGRRGVDGRAFRPPVRPGPSSRARSSTDEGCAVRRIRTIGEFRTPPRVCRAPSGTRHTSGGWTDGVRRTLLPGLIPRDSRAAGSGAPRATPRARGSSDARAACPSGSGPASRPSPRPRRRP